MKKLVLVLAVLLVFILSSDAKYHTKWIDITSPGSIKYTFLDADSVNIHNGSVYYAVKRMYKHFGRDLGEIYIIQYKNNKIGIVEYGYATLYQDVVYGYVDKPHPAYTPKQAKEFKDIDKNSFFYKANKEALKIVEVKKNNPKSMYLQNGLYGIDKK